MIYYVTIYEAGVWNKKPPKRIEADTIEDAVEQAVGLPVRDEGSVGDLIATVRNTKDAQPIATFYRYPASDAHPSIRDLSPLQYLIRCSERAEGAAAEEAFEGYMRLHPRADPDRVRTEMQARTPRPASAEGAEE